MTAEVRIEDEAGPSPSGFTAKIAVESSFEMAAGPVNTVVGRLIAAVLIAVLALLPSTLRWCRWRPWGGWAEKNSVRR
ncbi:hypothetical protein [Mycolicibacterium brumae]|uniref:Uncharacterized protein n=1 Tax=Mycolicibacterium brumae TaxID=85968 RepID=A0A2G5P990_9MYCO|nr:hypothetical protein [Mycolicibacterium brumae]MCV7193979.1 hypothetical protein [Mycolicibacterium brumae]PIB74928.1 hypothetical protein CQY22_011230 [Mycolicibacterium brumae]RWA22443.1 hypothetical protein MBRU_12740 [Mycolicibacterium brumae DSM 44177]UWW08029.1 hypothetical protein L2Z93_001070 [Mycolicibacterium brumae]